MCSSIPGVSSTRACVEAAECGPLGFLLVGCLLVLMSCDRVRVMCVLKLPLSSTHPSSLAAGWLFTGVGAWQWSAGYVCSGIISSTHKVTCSCPLSVGF